jgi:hypothetical protein
MVAGMSPSRTATPSSLLRSMPLELMTLPHEPDDTLMPTRFP